MEKLFYILLLISCNCFAQARDYLIMYQGDTIHGTYINRNSINNYIRFQTDNGKINIPTKEVKGFYWKKRKYYVYEDPCEGGFSAYRVLIEGTVSFLNSGGYEDYCPDLISINNKIYPIIRHHHFSEEVWNVMSECPAFEEAYKGYYQEHHNKRIVWEWTYRKSRTKYLEMIRFYNANCIQ